MKQFDLYCTTELPQSLALAKPELLVCDEGDSVRVVFNCRSEIIFELLLDRPERLLPPGKNTRP
ncbi:hypothetical protein AB0P13_26340 [Rhodococcus pyridinivorans]|uniref:hypothetical protein n=1 Tax=Rhodococcus pyridinivorans TaxID=103816 RepID=UPI0034475662